METPGTTHMDDPASALEPVPYFHGLRPDERIRAGRWITVHTLTPGAVLPLGEAVLTLVLTGAVTLTRQGAVPVALHAGDWTDDLRAVGGRAIPATVTAVTAATVGVLDRAGLDGLFTDLPVVALPFVGELGREVRSRNDLLREVYLARTAGLPPASFQRVLGFRRRRLQREPRVALRRAGALLVRALFIEPSRQLGFWVFLGMASALVAARAVVGVILHRHLQGRLFALIASQTGHPIHVHHFNYGLTVVSVVGLLSLIPRARQGLRLLAFAFGFGVGLVADEFTLFWHLDPNYYQPDSLLAASLVLFALFQVVYARPLYAAVGRRLLAWVRA